MEAAFGADVTKIFEEVVEAGGVNEFLTNGPPQPSPMEVAAELFIEQAQAWSLIIDSDSRIEWCLFERVVDCGPRSTSRHKALHKSTSELYSPERALKDHDSSKSYKLKSKIVYKKFFRSTTFFLGVTKTREQTCYFAKFPTINN